MKIQKSPRWLVENKELKAELVRLEEELKIKLVPKDPEDSKNAIVEVRAGTGGDEAAIFAGDLFDMYRRYSDDLGWKLQILSLNESEKGGFKEISFSLEGFEVFEKMKYESGVHRVQRVPTTESQAGCTLQRQPLQYFLKWKRWIFILIRVI